MASVMQLRPFIDQRITVPMLGMVESFNVSVACAIILAEARRQREEAGFYNQRRLTDDQYQRLLFEWTQPPAGQILPETYSGLPAAR